MKTKTKKMSFPKIKFFWNRHDRPHNTDTLLINGKTVVFVACSIISAAINLIFISNLTKSAYDIGTLLSFPAAVLLGIMSVGLDLSKCLHAIQVNTLNELHRKLAKYPWAKRVKSVSRKWFTMYILYVVLSIITSVSLSSISIGAGITRNANTLKQIDEFIAQGEIYYNVDSTAKNINMQNLIGKATDTSEQDAIDFVNQQVNTVWPKIQEWQDEYTEFKNQGLNPDDYKNPEGGYLGSKSYGDYWTKRDREINNYLSSSKYSSTRVNEYNISRITLTAFETNVKANYLRTKSTSNVDSATDQLNKLTDSTMEEAYNWIITLNNVALVNPKTNVTVVFDTDKDKSTKVLVAAALQMLKALRVDVENDSGDIGSSSKIFMQLGSTIDQWKNSKNQTSDLKEVVNQNSNATGSFGSTEVMMMIMLLFLSLLCEIAINQFSPKTNISRKMLSQFSQYFPSDFNVNDFMLDVYIEQYNYGSMNKEQFDKAVEETLNMMKITKEELIASMKAKELIKNNKKSVKESSIKIDIPEVVMPEVIVPEGTNTIVSEPAKTDTVSSVVNVPEVVMPQEATVENVEASTKVEEPKPVRKIVRKPAVKKEVSSDIDNDEINSLMADCEDIIND